MRQPRTNLSRFQLSTGPATGSPRTSHDERVLASLVQVARNDVFSAAHAREIGVSADILESLVRSGAIHRLIRGWYSIRPPRDEADAHWLRAAAAYRRYEGRALISHQSALVGMQLPVHGVSLDAVHLTHRRGGTSRAVPGVAVHAAVPRLVAAMAGSVDRVPAAVAVVQSGVVGSPLTALVAADAALHRRLLTAADLEAASDVLAHHRGIGPVRAILREADARIESVGESILGHRLRGLGYEIVSQLPVETDVGVRYCDFRIVGTRVVVEFDGRVKYTDRRDLFEEKRREDAIRRRGWTMVRVVWSELDQLAVLRQRIDQAIRDARG